MFGCDRASAANRGVHTRLLHDGVLSLLLDLAEAHVVALLRFQNETHARTATQACGLGGWWVVGRRCKSTVIQPPEWSDVVQ